MCDWALVEELKHRRGDKAVAEALGVARDTVYTWRSRGRERFTDEQRAGLMKALITTMTAEEKEAASNAESLRRIEEKLSRLDVPLGRPRAAR